MALGCRNFLSPSGARRRRALALNTEWPGLPRVSEDANSRTTVALLEAALVVSVAPPAFVSEVARVLDAKLALVERVTDHLAVFGLRLDALGKLSLALAFALVGVGAS